MAAEVAVAAAEEKGGRRGEEGVEGFGGGFEAGLVGDGEGGEDEGR